MSVITFPESLAEKVSRLNWAQNRNDMEFRSMFGAQALEVSGPLWSAGLEFGDMPETESGALQALMMQLRGRTNQLALWNIARPAPLGTMRGTMTLAADAAQGATSLQLVTSYGENLLTFPEAFDNAYWAKTRSTVSANAAYAPDGTLTADKLVEDTTASNTHHVLRSLVPGGATIYTWSVYLKAAERSIALVQVGGFASQVAANSIYINLATGAFTATDAARSKIESVGDGWYRISSTITTVASPASIQPAVYMAQTMGVSTYTGDGASGLYVWGAKLEVASGSADYGFGKTLKAGDFIGIGSGLTQQVVMVTEDATSTGQGNITVNIEPPLRNAFSSGAAVTWDKPKALFRRQSSKAGWDYQSVLASGFSLDLLEDTRP